MGKIGVKRFFFSANLSRKLQQFTIELNFYRIHYLEYKKCLGDNASSICDCCKFASRNVLYHGNRSGRGAEEYVGCTVRTTVLTVVA